MQGALFCHPEKLLIASFLDNPNITRNNKAIKPSAFPNLSLKIKTMSDFYIIGTGTLLTKVELEEMFQVKVREENFIELHYVIKDDCSIPTFLPYQPLLLRKDVMNLNTHLVNIES